MFKRTYLYRVLKADKILFAIIAVYLLGVCYYALRQREEFPFFLFGMYSLKVAPQQQYTTYAIVYDTTEIRYQKLRDAQRELIGSSLNHAIPLMEAGKLNAKDSEEFKAWLKNYTSDMRLWADNKMQVFKLTCNYDEQGKIYVIDKKVVYTYATAE